MKKLYIYIISFSLYSYPCSAQSNKSVFQTIGRGYNKSEVKGNDTPALDSIVGDIITVPDNMIQSQYDYSLLSIEQLEYFIAKLEKKQSVKQQDVLSYYTGSKKELNEENVMKVINEVGLSNQLYVLAQSVLETGHYTSNVCQNYHNIFGLYNSRKKDYYRFARWEDSVVAYQKFIQYRYKGGDYLAFLKRIGYAEDPGYTGKVAKIVVQLYHQMKRK